jgi:hypothetical protein
MKISLYKWALLQRNIDLECFLALLASNCRGFVLSNYSWRVMCSLLEALNWSADRSSLKKTTTLRSCCDKYRYKASIQQETFFFVSYMWLTIISYNMIGHFTPRLRSRVLFTLNLTFRHKYKESTFDEILGSPLDGKYTYPADLPKLVTTWPTPTMHDFPQTPIVHHTIPQVHWVIVEDTILTSTYP